MGQVRMSDNSFGDSIVRLVLIFVFVAIVFSLLGLGGYMPLVTSVFTFLLVDHIEGFVAGAIVGAFVSPKTSVAGIPIAAILGVIVQYLLFH